MPEPTPVFSMEICIAFTVLLMLASLVVALTVK